MKRDGLAIAAAGGWGSRGDFGHGHLQLGAPRNDPFVLPQIVANPIIEQVVVAILRSPARLGFYNGNCAMPGSGCGFEARCVTLIGHFSGPCFDAKRLLRHRTQRLHMDGPHLYDSEAEAAAAGEQWPHLSNVRIYAQFPSSPPYFAGCCPCFWADVGSTLGRMFTSISTLRGRSRHTMAPQKSGLARTVPSPTSHRGLRRAPSAVRLRRAPPAAVSTRATSPANLTSNPHQRSPPQLACLHGRL